MIKLSNVALPIIEQDDYVFPSARFCTFAQNYKIYQIVVEKPEVGIYIFTWNSKMEITRLHIPLLLQKDFNEK